MEERKMEKDQVSFREQWKEHLLVGGEKKGRRKGGIWRKEGREGGREGGREEHPMIDSKREKRNY